MQRLRLPSWHFGLGRELGFAFWAMFFVEAAFGSYWNIWPIYIGSLGASVTVVGLLVGANGILRLLVMPPSAALADRLGAKAILVGARMFAFVGYFWAVFATHWTMLIPVVIAVGIGEIAFPQIQAHVAGQSSGNPTRIFAIIFVIGPGVALGIGPLLSGLAIGFVGLRGAIFLTALFTLASVICFLCLKNLKQPARKRLEGDADNLEPSSYRKALSDPNVRRIVILQGITTFSIGLGISLLPYFLEQVRGIPAERIAQLGAIQAVGTIAFGIAVSRVAWLQRNPFGGAAIAVVAVTAGLVIFTLSDYLPLLMIGFVLRGCVFSAWTLFSSAMGVVAEPADRSRGFALVELTGGTAFSLAPIIAGPIYELGPRVPLVVGIVLGILIVPVLIYSQREAHRMNTMTRAQEALQG